MAEGTIEKVPVTIRVEVTGHKPEKAPAICNVLTTFGLNTGGWMKHFTLDGSWADKDSISISKTTSIYGEPSRYCTEIADTIRTIDQECNIYVRYTILGAVQ